MSSSRNPFAAPGVRRDADPFLVRQMLRPMLESTRAVMRAPSVRPLVLRILVDTRRDLARVRVTDVDLDRALGAIVRALRADGHRAAAREAARLVRESRVQNAAGAR